ncbi:acyclic terpene utilization AtuA family protein [Nocardioides sp. HDW12B]|nr:acyclic terpene utilization AtuA family protein [Nocardioides sp. HDW12B]
MREMLEGGELDVLTGDYLAELTMLILGRDQMKDPALGYARTFVRQAEDCLGLALERGVRLVANAGGLNPAGLAARLTEVAAAQGLSPRIAWVDGDNLIDRAAELGLDADGSPLTANAYLGAFGIAAALDRGADVVVTGRVTDASVVVGPAVSHFGWTPTSYDELAGAVVAGHVIECGAQATGGNFSGFHALLDTGRAETPLGFPVAEIAADGSSVITKHDGTGGLVTVDTVTAQLVYEIQSTAYLGPDVTTHLDSIELAPAGPDRVAVSGVRGSAPPATLKVCLNHLGGFRNQMELVLTGLDIEAKSAWVRRQVEAAWAAAGTTVASLDWALARTDHPDADTQEAASARLRVSVRDPDASNAGKAFTAPLVELALASYPGFTLTTPPAPATPYGIYKPGYVPATAVTHTVHHHDGSTEVIDPVASVASGGSRSVPAAVAGTPGAPNHPFRSSVAPGGPVPSTVAPGVPETPSVPGGSAPTSSEARDAGRDVRDGAAEPASGTVDGPGPLAATEERRGWLGPEADSAAAARTPLPTVKVPLGRLVHARSGDKGGDANLGLWVSQDHPLAGPRTEWLLGTVTPEWVRGLLPEAEGLEVEVFALPNLGGVNVVVRGLLGEGVAASSRFDPQAKGLGEWARSRHVDVPEELL